MGHSNGEGGILAVAEGVRPQALTDQDGRVVEGPAEPAHWRVAVHLAGYSELLQPGGAVDTLLTGVTLRCNCVDNNVYVFDTH